MIGLRKAAAAVTWMFVCLCFTEAPASGQALTPPWMLTDIGSPNLTGSVSGSSGSIGVDGAGEGLLDARDQFTFVYQPVTGDVDLRVRVDDVVAVTQWSTAGVMIRASLTPTSAHASVLWTPDGSQAYQRRTASGGMAVRSAGGNGRRWLRLVRAGTVVSAYSSVDGVSWLALGSDTVALGATAYVGVAVSSHDPTTATTAWISNLSATAANGSGLTGDDVGTPRIAGRHSVSSGRFTITAAGTGLKDLDDEFYFVHRPVTGDVMITARVLSIVNGDRGATAGVSLRESFDPSSTHASVAGTRGGWIHRRRTTPDGYAPQNLLGSGTPPGWVRLVRVGSQIEAFRSADGKSWARVGSDTIAMGATIYVGLAVTSRVATKTTTAVIDNVQIVESSPTTSNLAPVVALSASAPQTTAPASVTLTATASDSDGTVTAVEFHSGQIYLGTATTQPFMFTAAGLAAGTHTFRAVAVDDRGARTTSTPVAVVVQSSNVAPTVRLTSPSAGQSFAAPATMQITADAVDADGTIAAVEFYAGSTLLARDTAAPYGHTVSGLVAGQYAVQAVAIDNGGAATASGWTTVTVVASTQTPTGVAFTASSNHATSVTSYSLEIYGGSTIPGSAPPVAVRDLGKPAPSSTGDITVWCATFFSALPSGSYTATVRAIGPSGSTRSPALTFVR